MTLQQYRVTDEIFQEAGLQVTEVENSEDLIISLHNQELKLLYPGGYIPTVASPQEAQMGFRKKLTIAESDKVVFCNVLFGSWDGDSIFRVEFQPGKIRQVLMTLCEDGDADVNETTTDETIMRLLRWDASLKGMATRLFKGESLDSTRYLFNIEQMLYPDSKPTIVAENASSRYLRRDRAWGWLVSNAGDQKTWYQWCDAKIHRLFAEPFTRDDEGKRYFRAFSFDDGLTYCAGFVINPMGALLRRDDAFYNRVEGWDGLETECYVQKWDKVPDDCLEMLVESYYGEDGLCVKVWFNVPKEVTLAQKYRVAMLEADFGERVSNCRPRCANDEALLKCVQRVHQSWVYCLEQEMQRPRCDLWKNEENTDNNA